jgi:prefoldin subunit 5
MYGFDYAYEPAYEATGFFGAVRELIRNTREKIKDFMEKVKTKLRRLTNNKDQIAEDSAEAIKIVDALSGKITELLSTVGKCIDDLYQTYERLSDESSKVDTGRTRETYDNGANGQTVRNEAKIHQTDFSRYGGMDKFKAKDDASKKEWQKAKIDLGNRFSAAAKTAEECSKDLKELTSMGKLSYDATKHGYDGLRKMFDANNGVENSWKKVQVAADWSTGGIKESLNKVISLYKVGVKATNAFGNRLIAGNYRDDSGDRLEKEDRRDKMRADRNRIKIHREDEDYFDITTKRKDLKDAAKADVDSNNKFRQKSSYTPSASVDSVGYILDRLYKVAYEDAMNEFDKRDEYLAAYESVPGAFEFVEDDCDLDLFD